MHKKVDKANRVLKVADNEYSGTKSDAEVEKEEIGCISAKYESNNNPKAVGYDNGGGYSYGKYQIETKHGTMLDYIKYLKTKPEYRENAIGMDITNMSDEELVNKVYDERSKVEQYFSRIEKDKRKNIKEKRLPNERATILKLLNK